MSVEFFAQKLEDLTCLLHIRQKLAKKLDPTLKPSNLKEITCLLISTHKSQNGHAFFER